MPGAIANPPGGVYSRETGGYPLCVGAAATLMNPLSVLMNPLSAIVAGDQKDASDHKDLMHEMIVKIQKRADETTPVDLGGKDTRPSDLAAHFEPNMDQDIRVYTGSGDDMVIIV